MDPFSKRHNYRGPAAEITIREDAPESLRFSMLDTTERLGWGPSAMRDVVCRVLRVPPDSGNWSEYPNIWGEVQGHVYAADWFRVYDMIEEFYASMARGDDRNYREGDERKSKQFADAMNSYFLEDGIGWQLVDGQIVTRGPEAFETLVGTARHAVSESERPTAASHIHEALAALSRRPDADLSGAVYHGMGALECIARDVTGDKKGTLGEILKRNPDLVPKPLDAALDKAWGFASDRARHVLEGHEPTRDDAELIVGIAAAVATYLVRKTS